MVFFKSRFARGCYRDCYYRLIVQRACFNYYYQLPRQCRAAFSCACKFAIALPVPYNTLARTCTLLVVVQAAPAVDDVLPVLPAGAVPNCKVPPV